MKNFFINLAIVSLVTVGIYLYQQKEVQDIVTPYVNETKNVSNPYIDKAMPMINTEPEKNTNPSPKINNNFKCDGRTHCSQMKSCDEATFFLRNCPNVKMDGDGDGIPCEKQWCSRKKGN